LDYRQIYKVILGKIRKHLVRRAFASYCYACVLLIQFRNGSRVNEAYVRVRKWGNSCYSPH
jgi:hypothetical protein